MAIVQRMTHAALERDAIHYEAECTYSVVVDTKGTKYLQIDTYGSSRRKFRGKKSQSMRFAPQAIAQLKQLLSEQF
jgi:hypothetical protein